MGQPRAASSLVQTGPSSGRLLSGLAPATRCARMSLSIHPFLRASAIHPAAARRLSLALLLIARLPVYFSLILLCTSRGSRYRTRTSGTLHTPSVIKLRPESFRKPGPRTCHSSGPLWSICSACSSPARCSLACSPRTCLEPLQTPVLLTFQY